MGVRRIVALVSGSLLMLSGCGGATAGPTTVTAQIPVTVTATPSDADDVEIASPSSQSAAVPPTSSASSESSPVPFGTAQTWTDIKITVHGIDRNVPSEYPSLEPEKIRTAIDIEACALGPDVAISGQVWSLVDVAGGRYKADDYTSEPKLPEYPARPTELLDGECLRGWLIMEVPPGTELTTARYAPTDADGRILATLLWQIS